MCTIKLMAILILVVYLRSVTGVAVPDCPDDQRIIFTAQPTDMEVIWGKNDSVIVFPCQYEGSVLAPQWIINSTLFGSLNSQLPENHFYHNRTLSVRNIQLWQNTTTYQCQISFFDGVSFCAYRSTIGQLIIRYRATVISRSTFTIINSSATAFGSYSMSNVSLATTSMFYPLHTPLTTSSYEIVTSLLEISISYGDKIHKSVLIGAITISTVCSIFITVLIAIPFGLWYHKRTKSGKSCIMLRRNKENIYDEPSLPDPIYQEVTSNNMSPRQEIQIEMMKNYSYTTVRNKNSSTILLKECPAYIQRQI